jgi:hypothetical protein
VSEFMKFVTWPPGFSSDRNGYRRVVDISEPPPRGDSLKDHNAGNDHVEIPDVYKHLSAN